MKKILFVMLLATVYTTIATAQQKEATPAKVIIKSEVQETRRMRETLEQQQLSAAPEQLGKAECKGKKTKSRKAKRNK